MNKPTQPRPIERRHSSPSSIAVCLLFMFFAFQASAEDVPGRGPLHVLSEDQVVGLLPAGSLLLTTASAVERFLDQLDGAPPDWSDLYGHGHHDPRHDDRLFALNRERDAKRTGNPALSQMLTFAWVGELSNFDREAGGYSVSLGPKFISTRWGIVRFKPEEAPGNLMAVPDDAVRQKLNSLLAQSGPIEIEVMMTGRLIPDESLVYDFSHAEEGRGLIMPFVRVGRVDFVYRP